MLPRDILFEISKHLEPPDIINLFIALKQDVPIDIVLIAKQKILYKYGCGKCYADIDLDDFDICYQCHQYLCWKCSTISNSQGWFKTPSNEPGYNYHLVYLCTGCVDASIHTVSNSVCNKCFQKCEKCGK